jgi:DNA-binding CsgD family transcriptional regulator/DNA-directed RNA polymerase subunit RPC12/RpoP
MVERAKYLSPLSKAESRVLKAILEGKTTENIASEMNISTLTVNGCVGYILKRTGCPDRKTLIDWIKSERIVFNSDFKTFHIDNSLVSKETKKKLKEILDTWGYEKFRRFLFDRVGRNKEDRQIIMLIALYDDNIKNLSKVLLLSEDHITSRVREILVTLQLDEIYDISEWLYSQIMIEIDRLKWLNISLKCPRCSSNKLKKNGMYKDKQIYKCNNCGKKFNIFSAQLECK